MRRVYGGVSPVELPSRTPSRLPDVIDQDPLRSHEMTKIYHTVGHSGSCAPVLFGTRNFRATIRNLIYAFGILAEIYGRERTNYGDVNRETLVGVYCSFCGV